MKRMLALFLSLLLLTGCNLKSPEMDPFEPSAEPVVIPEFPEPEPLSPGSLYNDQNTVSGFFSDTKAARLNDIVLISITESTTATSSSTTALERTNEVDMGISSFFGFELNKAPDGTRATRTDVNPAALISAKTEKQYDGAGSTQRSGLVRGSVAARVIKVLPNQYLVIQGYKQVLVNGELGRIYISGIVNPLMIQRDGSISSDKIADLTLKYGGRGIVSAQQKPGLFSRLLDIIWPF